MSLLLHISMFGIGDWGLMCAVGTSSPFQVRGVFPTRDPITEKQVFPACVKGAVCQGSPSQGRASPANQPVTFSASGFLLLAPFSLPQKPCLLWWCC